MGKQASIVKEPAEPQGDDSLENSYHSFLLLLVLPPTELSNFHPQSKMIYRQRLLNDGGRLNIYHAIAEKAGCSVRDVSNLAFDGPHSINILTAQRIIGAVGSIQGKAIGESEMLHLFAD